MRCPNSGNLREESIVRSLHIIAPGHPECQEFFQNPRYSASLRATGCGDTAEYDKKPAIHFIRAHTPMPVVGKPDSECPVPHFLEFQQAPRDPRLPTQLGIIPAKARSCRFGPLAGRDGAGRGAVCTLPIVCAVASGLLAIRNRRSLCEERTAGNRFVRLAAGCHPVLIHFSLEF
jgi:hypothetical protein